MGDNIWLPDRNGVRTPMQWFDGATAGFSAAPPELLYLPLIQDPVFGTQQVNVVSQQQDPESQLNLVRRMIAMRKAAILPWDGERWHGLRRGQIRPCWLSTA